jgi:two-component system, cell cycle sensor histidine kinase and response regulator CckA
MSDTAPDAAEGPRKPATILIVDDEAHIRALLGRVLEGRGYHVLCALDGEEGLSRLGETSCPVELLITDVSMPRVPGPELIRRARELRPSIRVICLSARIDEASRKDGTLFVPKPFSPGVLADLVETFLSKKTDS